MKQFYLKNIQDVEEAYEIGNSSRNRYPFKSQNQKDKYEMKKKMEELNEDRLISDRMLKNIQKKLQFDYIVKPKDKVRK